MLVTFTTSPLDVVTIIVLLPFVLCDHLAGRFGVSADGENRRFFVRAVQLPASASRKPAARNTLNADGPNLTDRTRVRDGNVVVLFGVEHLEDGKIGARVVALSCELISHCVCL